MVLPYVSGPQGEWCPVGRMDKRNNRSILARGSRAKDRISPRAHETRTPIHGAREHGCSQPSHANGGRRSSIAALDAATSGRMEREHPAQGRLKWAAAWACAGRGRSRSRSPCPRGFRARRAPRASTRTAPQWWRSCSRRQPRRRGGRPPQGRRRRGRRRGTRR